MSIKKVTENRKGQKRKHNEEKSWKICSRENWEAVVPVVVSVKGNGDEYMYMKKLTNNKMQPTGLKAK